MVVELKLSLLLPWSPPSSSPFFFHFPPTILTQNPIFKKISATLESSSSSVNQTQTQQLTARERRKLRNERRESNPSYNWKEEVEMKLIKKPKKRYASWTEELNLDTLALEGPQWWVVRVSRVTGHETAQRLARAMARNFPAMDFQMYVPSVQIKRKLKNGTISEKSKPIFPGCVFLKCLLNKEVHDFIRECDGVGGFIGSKVGNTKRQINKPRPVDAGDMEAIFKQTKEEQEKADQSFLEELQGDGSLSPEKLLLDASLESTTQAKPRGKTGKAKKSSIVLPSPGSTVKVVSGSFAGFSGVLKKLNKKTGLATVGFTLFGKETLADLELKAITAEMD